MEFANDLHREAYEHVRQLLTELYGEMFEVTEASPMFRVHEGSTIASALVMPWGDDRCVVEVRAYVVLGAELVPELMRYLLEQNNELMLGAFGIDSEGDVFFSHSILANDLDKSELRASINAVKFTADKYDDELQARWGGQRMADR